MLRRIVPVLMALVSLGLFPAAASAEGCPNEQLRVANNSTQLPDCRAYEQVSPRDKNGSTTDDFSAAGDDSIDDPLLIGEDGNSALLEFNGAVSESKYGGYTSLRATRTAQGWTSSVLSPPRADERPSSPFGELPFYLGASSDTSKLLFSRRHLDTSEGFNVTERLELVGADGAYAEASKGSLGGPDLSEAAFAGMSTDASHLFFQSSATLESGASGLEGGASMLYERLPAQGLTRVVGILPNGSLASRGAILGSGGYDVPNASAHQAMVRHAVSVDGSHVVFSASPAEGSPPELYDRIDAQRTIQLSAPQRTGGAGAPPTVGVRYQDASADGSSVFFLSDAQLTDDDTDSNVDLYRFTFNAAATGGTLTRISGGLGAGTSFDGEIGLVAASEDGQVAYFVSTATLEGHGTPGAPNLYVNDRGTVRFVATLSTLDHVVAQSAPNDSTGGISYIPQAQTTPDGAKLLFQTHAQVTSFANAGFGEIYTYTLPSKSLSCISCTIVSAAPTADASLSTEVRSSFFAPARNISDDGSWIFFQAGDALVPGDVNGKQDVYEWHDGIVSLLSGGQGSDDSFFAGSDVGSDKRDVFFLTVDKLTPSDTDTAYDLYDARIGGGFPAPPGAPPGCSADCQGESTAPPPLTAPASALFAGAGNLAPSQQTLARPKVLSRSQKLAGALRSCNAKRNRHKRAVCQAQARKRYGSTFKAKKGSRRLKNVRP
ncbi:MAG: hypothetical protein QOI89_2367 [Solirubrobacteraceae bacterium]|jgi:hypothetical protein|nr:hypothetical protein [Solirubrobacteraceae bacterium]